jgi:alcohol dehydrogenase class IV
MTDPVGTFRTVDMILTGAGSVSELGRIASGFGRKALVVTGKGSLRRSGALDRCLRILQESAVSAALFEGVEEDPTVATVDAIRMTIRREAVQVVIGIGGGSAMDAAKAAAGLASEGDSMAVFLHEQKTSSGGLPAIAVPTTSGTGAEATPNAVISDPSRIVKASIRNGEFLPKAAIVDPEMTLGVPPNVTAAGGMDALTQAVESFVSIHASPITDALAFDAFRLLAGSIERAYRDGSDIQARSACAYGSLMAGMALASARLGAVHGMAHPLGVRYRIPHGLVCAVLLPEVVRINIPFSPDKFSRLSRVADRDIVEAIREMNARLGIYEEWKRFRIPIEDYGTIAEESLPSGSLKANPKKFTRDDVIAVLQSVAV